MNNSISVNYYEQIDISLEMEVISFLEKHPQGNPFQHPSLFKIWMQTPGYKPVLFTVRDKVIKGLIIGVIQREPGYLKGYFSRRCVVIGGPLFDHDQDSPGIRTLIRNFTKYVSKSAIYIEVRNLFETSNIRELLLQEGFSSIPHMNFHVQLDKTSSFKRLSSGKQRQVKKSLKEGASVIMADSEEQVYQFYLILKDLYFNKIKKPLPHWFLYRNFFHSDAGKYLLIRYNEQIIGGIMCLIFKNTIFEWYVGGMDKYYKGIYPSVLATWAGIKYGMDHDLRKFDFLGAGNPERDYGVRDFKAQFGGDPVYYGRYLYISKPISYRIGIAGRKLLSILS